MRATARRILDQVEADPSLIYVVDKVNALEAPLDPSAAPIPAAWTPEHVCKRIVEAFETLAKLPPIRGPKAPGNSWPQHIYDWEDRLAQEELSEREKARRQRQRNRSPLRPTGEDLRRMDIVFEWLSDLHKADEGLCRVVQAWARLRATDRSVKEGCRRRGISFQAFYRQRDKGIATIVAALGGVPVW